MNYFNSYVVSYDKKYNDDTFISVPSLNISFQLDNTQNLIMYKIKKMMTENGI